MDAIISIIAIIVALVVGWGAKSMKWKFLDITDRDFERFKPGYSEREQYRRIHGEKMDDKTRKRKAIEARNKADKQEKQSKKEIKNASAKETIARFMRSFTRKPNSDS